MLTKAESTDFPEEADAFTAKVQELMARHRIDHALLVATTGERDQPVTGRVSTDNPYEAPKTLLLQVVAEANSCRAVWRKRFGSTTIVVPSGSGLDRVAVHLTARAGDEGHDADQAKH